MHKLLFFIYVLIGLSTINVKGQVGQEFWFVAPDVCSETGDDPVIVRITAFDANANVKISLPAENNKVLAQFTVSANSQYSVELSKDDVENSPSNTINNKGLLITSDADVTVYYEVSNQNNAEKFVLKEDNALGKKFFVPSQNIYQNDPFFSGSANEKVDIVATEDNTTIEIIPTNDITGHIANESFNIILNKGQTYCLECTDISNSASLVGTEITSDKRIAVTISDDAVIEDIESSVSDLIGDQLIPVNAIGTEYVAINTSKSPDSFKNTNSVQKVFVTAIEDNTLVFVNNTTKNTKALQKGEVAEFDISDHSLFIYATKKVYAYQVTGLVNTSTGIANELGSSVLPNYNCNGSRSVSFTRVFNRDFWVNIIVKRKDNKSFVLYDSQGNELNLKKYINSWQTVPGQDTGPDAWVCCAVNLDDLSTGNPYVLENTSGVFHLCILDENGEDDELGCVSFGYFSSYNSFWIEGADMACKGDVIELTAKEGMKSYTWYSAETGNTILSTDRICTVTKSGTYYVEGEVNAGECFLADSLYVDFLMPQVELGNDTSVCLGEELFYSVDEGYVSYIWNNGDSDNQTSILAAEAGEINLKVEVTNDIGCTKKDSVGIKVNDIPVIQLDKTEVCEGASITNTTSFYRYEWLFNGEVLNESTSQNWIIPQETGVYTLTAWTEDGCSATEDINITVNSLPSISLEDSEACDGENIIITGPSGFSNYLWSTGAVTQNIELNASANYWLEVTDANGCKAKDEATLTYYKPATIDLGPDKDECVGVDIYLSGDPSFNDYKWTFESSSNPGVVNTLNPDSPNVYEITSADVTNNGIYKVEATDVNGCTVSDEVNVTLYQANPPELVLTENLCDGDVVDIIATEGYDTYTWYQDGNHISVSDNLNQLADVDASGVYSVETTLGVCIKKSAIQVVSHTLPSVELPDDFSICQGETGELKVESFTSASGADFDYLFWNNNESLKYSDWQTSSLDVSKSGNYMVTAVDSYGCRATDQITVAAFIPENIELGLPQSFCQNTSITLENPVVGAQNYQWYQLTPSSQDLLVQNSLLEVNDPGTYLLKVTDANGCKVSDQVVVNENPLPQVNIMGDPTKCGQTILYAESPDSNLNYEWNETPGLNSNQIGVNQSGTYQVQVWDANGCTAMDEVDVTIYPIPTISLSDQSACEGETIIVDGPSGFESYQWSTGDVSLNTELTSSGTFGLQVIDANGCTAKDEATVSFIKPVTLDLGEDKEDCVGSSLTLSGDDQHNSWEWTFISSATQESTTIASSDKYEITNSTVEQSGIYHVEAKDINGCPVSDEVSLTFYSAEPPLLSATEDLCQGETINVLASSGYDSYTWYLNDIEQPEYANLSQLNNINIAGTYRVEATLKSCVIRNEIEVVSHELPQVQLPDNLMICNGVQTTLTVENFESNDGSFDYLYWNDDESIRYGNWETASLKVESEGRYSVTAVDEYGCKTNDYVDVFRLPVPDLLADEASVCQDDMLSISVKEGYSSYLWSNGDTDNQTQVFTSEVGDINLGITVTDEKGCIATDNITVQVNPIPSINLNKTEVCSGSSITNMSDFVKYEWVFNGEIINTVESQNWIIPGVSGIYTITGWTEDGCMVSKDINVTVHSLPEITLDEKIACAGTSVEINGPTGFSTYSWSTGETTQDIVLTNASNYWVEVTDANGCVGRADASLKYIQPMEMDLGEDKNECIGVSLQLTANPDYTNYNWSFEPASNPGAYVSLNPEEDYLYEIQDAELKNSGVYYVEAKDQNGCAVSDEVSVMFYTAPPPELRITEDLCIGQEIDIIASEGYDTYAWYEGENHLSGFDNQTLLSGVNKAAVYKLEATKGSCVLTQEIEVVERGLPTVSLSNEDKLCKGETINVTVNNYSSTDGTALNYLYWNSEETKRYFDWQTAELAVNNPGSYKVTVVDEYGCTASDEISIEGVTAEPLDLGDPIRICDNDRVLLENPVSNVLNTQWYQVLAESDELLSNDGELEVYESGIYRLQIEDLNGCINEDKIAVNVMPLPDVVLVGDPEACESTELSILDENPNYIYQWNGDENLTTSAINVNESGIYTLEVWDKYGCYNSTESEVVIYNNPVLILQNDTVCAGETTVLTGPQETGMQYLWSTGQRTSSINVSKGNYSLLVTDNNGCSAKANVSVAWREVPVVDLGPDMIICPLGKYDLDAGANYSSYLWHSGEITQTIIADLLDTVNTVIVTDQYGCNGFDSQTVKYKQIPELDLCSDTSVCASEIFVLDVGSGFVSYLWNDGDESSYKEVNEPGEYSVQVSDGCFIYKDTAQIVFLDEPIVVSVDSTFYGQLVVFAEMGTEPYSYSIDGSGSQTKNIFKNLKNGEHEIYVTDANGCQALVTIVLDNMLDVDVPPFFTPNDDGNNDRWVIDGIEKLPDSIIKIYNRYGKLLIKYKASDPGWDGRYLGRPVPTDDYWYVVELANTNKVLKGHITLKR